VKILDEYVTAGPSRQAIVDIFAGEWSSKFPADSGLSSTPGPAALFEDPRIAWLSQEIGGFEGKSILELGPLEAGHTYMMCKGGAKSVTSVEANSRSLMKCLCVKEIFDLSAVKFLFGDAEKYLASTTDRYDLCVASGILYHMVRPLDFLKYASNAASTLFLWTHYFDGSVIRKNANITAQFNDPVEIQFEGRSYEASKRDYGKALDWAGFCGGSASSALWLTRDSLFRAIEDCGMKVSNIAFDQPDHPNGPSVAIVARRRLSKST
jgi:hypothetical protein